MNIPYTEIVFLIILTGINAFFTGSEIAFVALREGQLARLEETDRGMRVVRLARTPNRFLATCQIGITLAGFFASASAAVSLAKPVKESLGFLGGAADPVSVILVTIVLAYFTLVFGELAPKRIALQRAESWATGAAVFLSLLAQATRPFIWLLDRSTNIAVKISGNDPKVQREEVTEEEIRDLLESQEGFTEDQRSIISGAFDIAERTLREIVVPRNTVFTIASDLSAQEALIALAESGHSRAPIHTGDLDDVLGIIHIRELVRADGPASDYFRPAPVLPESLGVLDALRRLQSGHQQMAIVVNEHGGVEGIVTVEDLLEEIVGEIYDEFDTDVANVKYHDDSSITVPGSFAIHDLPDINVELPDGEGSYATVAGYVLDQLGHIPQPGETVTGEKWDVEVEAVHERAITQVRLHPKPSSSPETNSTTE